MCDYGVRRRRSTKKKRPEKVPGVCTRSWHMQPVYLPVDHVRSWILASDYDQVWDFFSILYLGACER